nr:MerR family transcriptional regulator [Sphingomonas colocasiae]
MTIGELSDSLGLPQHILRYWETRFPQLRPLQRAGKRRYYRPEDVALAQRINRLLNQEGYTIKGVQKLLSQRMGPSADMAPAPAAAPAAPQPSAPAVAAGMLPAIRQVRADLARALADA